MASSLDRKFDLYAGARHDKETEWTIAIRQYQGQWDADDRSKVEKALESASASSLPTVNITRPKTNVAIARMQDIQFPLGGDFNFTLAPSPVPRAIEQALNFEGQDSALEAEGVAAGLNPEEVPTPAELAQDSIDSSEEAARLMTREIRDDLVEAKYGAAARLAMEDLCILGTAVIKGPTLSYKKSRSYTPEGELVVMHEIVPDVQRVDPRLFYPDPSARETHDIGDAFEVHLPDMATLRDWADTPAFMRDQIRKVLMQEPDASELPSSIQDTSYRDTGLVTRNRYVVKEYHGLLDKAVLFEGGLISEEEHEDPLAQFMGEVWLAGRTVIRLSLSPIAAEDSTPYGVATWERDHASVFGHGMPYLLRHPSRVVNNAYLMLLDNASLTSGPQIVMNKEMIEPADRSGDYSLSPHKIWFMTEYGEDVRQAMQFVDIPAQMEGVSSIIDMAMQFADVESSTPMIQQGEMPAGNNTLTGLAMVTTASNIVQKRASMCWDDQITVPLITRLFHYNMQYNDNQDIRGDMVVKIGGATDRIEAELNAQHLERILGLSQTSEEFAIQVDSTKAFRKIVDNSQAGDILRSSGEVQEMMAQQQAAAQGEQEAPDPRAIQAQAMMIEAQAKAQSAMTTAEHQKQTLAFNMAKQEQQTQLELAKLESQKLKDFVDMQKTQDARELALMKMAAERNTTVEKMAQELNIAVINNETQRQKIMVDLTKQREEIDHAQATGEGI
jgi:hypothetical protein